MKQQGREYQGHSGNSKGSSLMSKKRPTPSHIIMKFQNRAKEKILKALVKRDKSRNLTLKTGRIQRHRNWNKQKSSQKEQQELRQQKEWKKEVSHPSKHQEKGKYCQNQLCSELQKLTKDQQQSGEHLVKKNDGLCGVLTWLIPTPISTPINNMVSE